VRVPVARVFTKSRRFNRIWKDFGKGPPLNYPHVVVYSQVGSMANIVSFAPADSLASTTDSTLPDAHGFGLSVQSAIGPKQLDGRGLQGRVLVAFSLGVDGALKAVRITQSSGHHELDSQVLKLVGAATFPTPPATLTSTQRNFLSAFTFS
jgi:TonB family protein